MAIEYTYEIVAVNADNDVMEVKYTSLEHGEALVGMPLPRDGEVLEDIVRAFSPVVRWDYAKQDVVAPVVGTKGTLAQDTPRDIALRARQQAEAKEDPIFEVGPIGTPVKDVRDV